jgi:phage gpG-like protein
MSAEGMTIQEATRWLNSLKAPGRFGFVGALRRIATHINKKTRENFMAHQTPEGIPWAKLRMVDKKHWREQAGIVIRGIDRRPGSRKYGELFFRYSKAYRLYKADMDRLGKQYLWKYADALALYRTRGDQKRINLIRAAGKPSHKQHIQRATATTLEVGTKVGGVLHEGGVQMNHGKAVTIVARPFMGLTKTDIDFVEKELADEFAKLVHKGVA